MVASSVVVNKVDTPIRSSFGGIKKAKQCFTNFKNTFKFLDKTNMMCTPKQKLKPTYSVSTSKRKRYNDDDEDDNFFKQTNVSLSPRTPGNRVEEVFKRFDDMFATIVPSSGYVTPHAKGDYDAVEMMVENFTAVTPSAPLRYVSDREVAERNKGYLEEQQEFLASLRKCGVELEVPGQRKVPVTPGFNCSTPVSAEKQKTPFLDRSITLKTPLSGVKPLNLDEEILDSPVCSRKVLPYTPGTAKLLQEEHIPEEERKTILLGVVTYVEVRTGKENRSQCVKTELLSLGARVEKSFNKKVTVVVFKEGLVSTYLKSKEWNVPLVSIMWIEACKKARGQVDPALFPPQKMEKYENILPFQTIKKRRLRFLKPKKENKDPKSPSFIEFKRNGRNAVTEAKVVHKPPKETKKKSNVSSKIRFSKKLNFGDDKGKEETKETEIIDLDSSSFSAINLSDLPRRVSAPATLGRKPKSRQRKLFEFKTNPKEKVECPLPSSEPLLENDFSSKENDLNEKPVKTTMESARKKVKLFNPNETYLSQESNNGVDMDYKPDPLPPPYIASEEKKLQMLASQGAKKLLKPKNILNKIEEEMDTTQTRKSMSIFDLDKRTPQLKQTPTLVFTSVSREDLPRYEAMVRKLGILEIEAKVSNRTTHVVSNGNRRTVNLLKGIARGCWIVDLEWLVKSDAAGTWLLEDQYELTSFSRAVLECRLEKQAFGKYYCMDIFKNCGPIYVSSSSSPPSSDLKELLRLCKAKVVNQTSAAEYLVGGKKKSNEKARVKETWILDSITQNTLLEIDCYTY